MSIDVDWLWLGDINDIRTVRTIMAENVNKNYHFAFHFDGNNIFVVISRNSIAHRKTKQTSLLACVGSFDVYPQKIT